MRCCAKDKGISPPGGRGEIAGVREAVVEPRFVNTSVKAPTPPSRGEYRSRETGTYGRAPSKLNLMVYVAFAVKSREFRNCYAAPGLSLKFDQLTFEITVLAVGENRLHLAASTLYPSS